MTYEDEVILHLNMYVKSLYLMKVACGVFVYYARFCFFKIAHNRENNTFGYSRITCKLHYTNTY